MTEEQKCRAFLNANGWGLCDKAGEYDTYTRDERIAVDVGWNELVLLDDTGDFLHLPMNYFALIGALFEYRAIPANYKSTSPYNKI